MILNTDALIIEFDVALKTLFFSPTAIRSSPADSEQELPLSPIEKKHSAALMRVNHVGEVCAQALYQGQALTCVEPTIQRALRTAALEETEHLAWTESRIGELGGRKSVLNPMWYAGSLCMGAVAGSFGRAANLGFLAETERQVGAHLERHLALLPDQDAKSRAVVRQMKVDENSHAEMAMRLGASELPATVKTAMTLVARLMTRVAYYA